MCHASGIPFVQMEGTTEVRDVMLERADDLCQAKSW